MKTAVSIPDDLYWRAEMMAKRSRRTRSSLYADALKSYLAQHEADSVTEAINRLVDEGHLGLDPFAEVAAGRLARRTEWDEAG